MKSRRILKQWYEQHLGIEAHRILDSTKPMHTAAVREFAQQVLWRLESHDEHAAALRRVRDGLYAEIAKLPPSVRAMLRLCWGAKL